MNEPIMYASGTPVKFKDGRGFENNGLIINHLRDIDQEYFYLIEASDGDRYIAPLNRVKQT